MWSHTVEYKTVSHTRWCFLAHCYDETTVLYFTTNWDIFASMYHANTSELSSKMSFSLRKCANHWVDLWSLKACQPRPLHSTTRLSRTKSVKVFLHFPKWENKMQRRFDCCLLQAKWLHRCFSVSGNIEYLVNILVLKYIV